MNGLVHFDTELSPERRAQWDEFVATSPHTATRQNSVYYDLEIKNYDKVYYVWAVKNNAIAFAGIFCLERFITKGIYSEAICWRGPVFDDPDFAVKCLLEVRDFFQTMRIGSVRIGPRWIFPEAESVETLLFEAGFSCFEKHKRRSTGLVRIARSDAALLDSFTSNVRSQLRRAQRSGVVVRPATNIGEANVFFDELSLMSKERGLVLESKRELGLLFSSILVDQEYGIVLNAYWNNAYLGGILLTRLGMTAYVYKFVVANNLDGRSPKYFGRLLYFEAMKWARQRGSEVVDLEGYDANLKSAGHQLSHIYLYKHGFSPTAVQTLSQYTIPVDKQVFVLWQSYRLLRRVSLMPKHLKFRIRNRLLESRAPRKDKD
jgi:lipid II:glycine glycyltransferase (peptidoglycan interpeptide bridge formation enzyme)